MPAARRKGRGSTPDSDDLVLATDDIEDDDFLDDAPRSSRNRKRKRSVSEDRESTSLSNSGGWTRQPIVAKKKKKKLIAGRELRDRGVRKVYAESSSDGDEDYNDDDEDEEQDEVEVQEEVRAIQDEVQVREDVYYEEEVVEQEVLEEKQHSRMIKFKIKSSTLQSLSQTQVDLNGEATSQEVAEATTEDLDEEVKYLQETSAVIDDDDDDDEGGPRRPTRRVTRQSSMSKPDVTSERPTHGRKGPARQSLQQDETNGEEATSQDDTVRHSMRHRLRKELRRPSREEKSKKKKSKKSESEFEDDESDEASNDDILMESEHDRDFEEEEYSSSPRKKGRPKKSAANGGRGKRSRNANDDYISEEDVDDLDAELREIGAEIPQRQRQLRPTERMNYFIPPPPINEKDDLFFAGGASGKKRSGGGGRGFGGFGGFGGDFSNMAMPDRFRGITGLGKAGGADDSSDSDEEMNRRSSTALGSLIPSGGGVSGLSGTPANLGKYTPKSKLADADPLGVDQNIDFTAVGGLDDYINQLKEMVTLPLLYPEIFQRFNVTPPRGVLFHGPPGTGKTLMARALAASCSTEGRKISFFMRKGADCLSKWVGEAERQLRLLFEEAKNSQPSIIFFDEIDGLAPVRSSKQEQIHASIVSTLLALMDGMDGRGQVIVIGATNRPDAVDPALRRPGRFDREFYFPLPDLNARKSIIDIHTKKWDPPLEEDFKMQLAVQTKGYGGADLRALCTEAALNAVQRRYPQIYSSTDKLLVDPKTINIIAKDFMIAMDKMVPSSERSMSSGAAPLPKAVKPLLEKKFEEIKDVLSALIPDKKKRNVLEEAMWEDDGPAGFEGEVMIQAFESARTFRPRLLIYGQAGMGQQYLGAAILHHLEKTHVQSFDLATLMGDSARTPEAALVQLFAEVRRHKPSVMYLPHIDLWFRTISDAARETFMTLIRGISPTEPILLLGLVESPVSEIDPDLRALFGYSFQNRVEVDSPSLESRFEYFRNALANLDKAPSDFPDAVKKKKRVLEVLEKAPPPPPKVWTKTQLEEQALKDKQTLNAVKLKLAGLMDLLRKRYQRFRKPIIVLSRLIVTDHQDDKDIALLARGEEDPACLALTRFRRNENGMIRDVNTAKTFYNMDIDQISDRLWNGYYLTPDQFVFDIQCMVHDAKSWPDRDRANRAEEMLINTQSYLSEVFDETLVLECQRMAEREFERQKILKAEKEAKAKKKAEREKEKERLRLAAEQAQNGESPAKMIESGPSNGVESNGDGSTGLGILALDNRNGNIEETGSQIVPSSSPPLDISLSNGPQPHLPYPESVQQPPYSDSPAGMLHPTPAYPQPNHYQGFGQHNYQPNYSPFVQPQYQPSHSAPPYFPQPAYAVQSVSLPSFQSMHQAPAQSISPPPVHSPYHPGGDHVLLAPQMPVQFGNQQPNNITTSMMAPPQRYPSPSRPPSVRPVVPSHPSLKKDPHRTALLLQSISQKTEGYTLEQLEQVYAACMDIIWRMRHEWDRTIVISETEKCVERVLNEIEIMKKERHQDKLGGQIVYRA